MHGFAPSDMEMEDELAKLAIKRNQLLTDMRASKDKKKAAIIMRAGKANRGPMVAELLSEMHLQWRIQGKSTGRNDDSEANETALSNASNFKGKCYKCGKDGHRAAQCESTIRAAVAAATTITMVAAAEEDSMASAITVARSDTNMLIAGRKKKMLTSVRNITRSKY